MIRKLFLICAAIFLSACAVDAETSNDQAIMDAVYNNVRVPDGFYKEENPNDAFYATSHIKNTEVGDEINSNLEPVYELSTTDYYTAARWDTLAIENVYSSYSKLIDISETELYYQFTHAYSDDSPFIRQARVFKGNIIDRRGVIRNCERCYQGSVNPDWLTLENAAFIVEYLWMFTLENNDGNSIFHTSIEEHPESYIYAMLRAHLTRNTQDGCDVINVYLHSYGIDKFTGEMYKDTMLLKTIYSQLSGGAPVACARN